VVGWRMGMWMGMEIAMERCGILRSLRRLY